MPDFKKYSFTDVTIEAPLVSIIIPTYSRAHLISETLDSILNQTYLNWECIVVDDGSTDLTKQVVQKYIDLDSRFQFHPRPNDRPKGANACRNYGFELSRGKFINWFDSDDLMTTDKLEIQIKELTNSAFDFAVCQSTFFVENSNNLKGFRHEHLTSTNNMVDYIKGNIAWSTIAPLWRKEFLNKNTITFNEILKAGQEWSFHCKALIKSNNFIANKRSLILIRIHEQNVTNNPNNLCEKFYNYYLSRKEIQKLIDNKDYNLYFDLNYTTIYRNLVDSKCMINCLKVLYFETIKTKRFYIFIKLLLFTIIFLLTNKGRKHIKI